MTFSILKTFDKQHFYANLNSTENPAIKPPFRKGSGKSSQDYSGGILRIQKSPAFRAGLFTCTLSTNGVRTEQRSVPI